MVTGTNAQVFQHPYLNFFKSKFKFNSPILLKTQIPSLNMEDKDENDQRIYRQKDRFRHYSDKTKAMNAEIPL